ncbi:hypothetical protein BK133_05265 [Paenibacillus sp. FSL H8-0548]|uniref:hypothetical protein n=1 Tax=Paenibacillus sp. FSL H8-0548 TaxID=1920422 RepID=UPI00096C9E92|nr:hypothetical protein [Paenibacillus sp. FSL H8-0548]OMF37467.1 hypothetical protein BK133_05265 [Paenibacillus sp. FSL H8-0548]
MSKRYSFKTVTAGSRMDGESISCLFVKDELAAELGIPYYLQKPVAYEDVTTEEVAKIKERYEEIES